MGQCGCKRVIGPKETRLVRESGKLSANHDLMRLIFVNTLFGAVIAPVGLLECKERLDLGPKETNRVRESGNSFLLIRSHGLFEESYYCYQANQGICFL